MCHERWITHSDAAVERSWIRSLSQRDRTAQPAVDDDDEQTEIEPREDARLEVVGER